MSKGVEVTLYDASGNAYASGTDIAVMWFDGDPPPNLGAIKGRSAVATTTSGGVLSLGLQDVTGLAVGDWGFLVCYKLDGTDHKDSPVFASRMQVASMTGTTTLAPVSSWTRPTNWLTLDVQDGQQKFQGLLAIYPTSNFVALRAQGAYTVDWGDGSSTANFASDAQAQKNIAYADIAASTDVGRVQNKSASFDGSTDTITVTAHGYVNDEAIAFYDLSNVTGLTADQTYYVRDRADDTFKVSSTLQGAAVDFSTTGTATGKSYPPIHRQCLVTLTMQSGQTLTVCSINQKHTQSGLQAYSNQWLDAAVAGSSLATLVIGGTSPTRQESLQSFSLIGSNAITTFTSMFNSCLALQSVPLLNTAAGTNFTDMFLYCYALQSVPLLNTAAGTTFSSMFNSCRNLIEGALKGTTRAISYTGCKLSGDALNRIYQNLGAPNGGAQTITVSNNWGTASDNTALAPSGWTVSGS